MKFSDFVAQTDITDCTEQAYAFARANADAPEVMLFHEFRSAFRDYDDIPSIVPGFDNSSWGNDMCPSVSIDIRGYVIQMFMDYRNVASREHFEGKQFALTCMTDNGEILIAEDFDVIPQGLAHRCLTAVYEHWLKANNIEAGCADELRMVTDNREHHDWLVAFCDAWEAAE